ncbi:MAG TPA: hypothetical protein VMY78_00755 [Solirubrobacteraceae bacterium]|nr:hypothetical protein [Solirubrobacteraceae bacterium]
MKLGKRRKRAEPVAEPAGVMAASAEPVPVKWSVAEDPAPADAEPVPPAEPYAQPEPDTIVDAEAVELPAEPGAEAPAPVQPETRYVPPPAPAAAYMAPAAAMPLPAAEQPVRVASSDAGRSGATPLSDAGSAYASGHPGGTSPSWPEPVMQLADERPEVVVGAAFAGGLLIAAILRRLGN